MLQPGAGWQDIQAHLKDGVVLCKSANGVSHIHNTLINYLCRPIYNIYHRLNGSSSHVLTATYRSYGKAKNSTHHRIETPDLIGIKFGTVDYVGEMTGAKFHANPSMGGFSANG